jgi:hypothetical protein
MTISYKQTICDDAFDGDIPVVNGDVRQGRDGLSHLRLTWFHDNDSRYIDSPKTIEEIQDVIDDLRLAVENADVGNFGLDTNHDAQAWAIIAEQGKKLFDAMVEPGKQNGFLKVLSSATGTVSGRRLVIVCGLAVRIPWNMVFKVDVVPGQSINFDEFLGTNLLVLHRPDQEFTITEAVSDGVPDAFVRAARSRSGREIGHIWDDKFLLHSQPINSRWYYNLTVAKRNELPPLSSLLPHRLAMNNYLLTFMTQSRDFLHFDCHGQILRPTNPHQTSICMRDAFVAQYDDLVKMDFVGNVRLLAILNVCLSGYGRLQVVDGGLAESFNKRGIGGIVAPMMKVPYNVAMQLSRIIYEKSNAGMTLIEAFGFGQQHVAQSNPGVLMYSPFGNMEFWTSALWSDAHRADAA